MSWRRERETENTARIIFAPLALWVTALGWYLGLKGLAQLVSWGPIFLWGGVVVLVLIGICFIPRSIRTIRGLDW